MVENILIFKIAVNMCFTNNSTNKCNGPKNITTKYRCIIKISKMYLKHRILCKKYNEILFFQYILYYITYK